MSLESASRLKSCVQEVTNTLKSFNSLNFNVPPLVEGAQLSTEDISDLISTLFTFYPKFFPAPISDTSEVYLQICSKALLKLLAQLEDALFTFQQENFSFNELDTQITVSIKKIKKAMKLINSEKTQSFTLDSSTLLNKSDAKSPETTSKTNSFKASEPSNFIFSLQKSLNDKESEFSATIISFFSTLSQKISSMSHQLETCSTYLSHFFHSPSAQFLKTLKIYNTQYKITSDLLLSDQNLVLTLSQLLSLRPSPISIPTIKILIPQVSQCPNETLLINNFALKSEILQYDTEKFQTKSLETQLKIAKDRIELLENVNKDLSAPKPDDSLDLETCNIKDAIEIQELRAALHSITEKYEQEKEILIRDMAESRQDMETQLFRTQNEKYFLEAKLKDLDRLGQEAQREKERLEQQIAGLKKEVDRVKDLENSSKNLLPRRRSSEFLFAPSCDYELSESIEKSDSAFPQEEITEILLMAKELGVDEQTGLQGLKNLLKNVKVVKNILEKEFQCDENLEIDKKVEKVLAMFKEKVEKLEKNEENLKEMVKGMKCVSEPTARRHSPDPNVLSMLQLEKSKLVSKKAEIHLHREQIAALKKNIRELQQELDKAQKMGHVKEVWAGLVREISVQGNKTEDMIEVFMKLIGFSSNDVKMMQNERRSKKSRMKFTLFGS